MAGAGPGVNVADRRLLGAGPPPAQCVGAVPGCLVAWCARARQCVLSYRAIPGGLYRCTGVGAGLGLVVAHPDHVPVTDTVGKASGFYPPPGHVPPDTFPWSAVVLCAPPRPRAAELRTLPARFEDPPERVAQAPPPAPRRRRCCVCVPDAQVGPGCLVSRLLGVSLVHEFLCDGAQLDVRVGGGSDKEREGTVFVQLMALHQDADSLADDLAGLQGFVQSL